MRTLKYFAIALMAVCLTSCGKNKNVEAEEDAPETFQLEAISMELSSAGYKDRCDLHSQLELVEEDYALVKEKYGSSYKLEVKVRRTKDGSFTKSDPKAYVTSYASTMFVTNFKLGFGITLFDENGDVIVEKRADESPYSSSEIEKIAAMTDEGEICILTFSFYDLEKTPAKFAITCCSEYEDKGTYEGIDPDDSDSSSSYADSDDSDSSSSEDWDDLLNSYEQYVNKYVSLVKKASKGDMSALTEYAEFLEKAQDLSEKMSDAKGEMSTSQWARYIKITNKMAAAAN